MRKFNYPPEEFFLKRPEKILKITEKITPILNRLHGLNYSSRFWLILLDSHIKTCINNEEFMCNNNYIPPKKLFLRLNFTGKPQKKEIIFQKIEYTLKAIHNFPNSKAKVFNIIKNYDNLCLGARGKELGDNNIGVFVPPHFPLLILKKNRNARKKIVNITNNFEDVFLKNVVQSIPAFYIEYFRSFHDKIPLHNPNYKSFHFEHLTSPFSAIIIAKYMEFKAKLYMYQLGGFIGELSYSPSILTYTKFDGIVTYGWKSNNKDIPGKPFRLMEYQREWVNTRNKITIPNYDIIVVFTAINKYSKEYYKEFSKYFLENINHKKYPVIKYRPRPKSKKLINSNELNYLNLPDYIVVDKGMKNMAKVAANAKIILQSALPSTNFLECIYTEQPVVAMDTNSYPSAIVKPYYEHLKKLKVIHEEVSSLVVHLNSVNIDNWWQEVLKDPGFKEFQKYFAGKN